MALQLKYTDEHGILHINMSPSGTPQPSDPDKPDPDLTDPQFDTINNRFGNYDLFGGKYACEGGDTQSLFRSRYNSIEEELANTPYAFTTERSLRLNASPLLDITIKSRGLADDASPSKDLEDDRFFRAVDGLFGPQLDFQTTVKTSDEEESPAFTVTQLIHAQDRYFDLSSRQSSVFDSPKADSVKVNSSSNLVVKSEPSSAKRERTVRLKTREDEAFKVLAAVPVKTAGDTAHAALVSPPKRKREKSFAIVAETIASRPSSPRSLPVEIRPGRVSSYKGRGFREDTSKHTTPKTSAPTSRASSPPRRRTNSLPRIDKMAAATLPPPIPPILPSPHSPRNFLKENMEEVRELSELNREKHEAEAERKRLEEEEALLIEMGLLDKNAKSEAIRSVVCSRTTSRSNSPSKLRLRSRSNSPSAMAPNGILHYDNTPAERERFINLDDGMPKAVTHNSRVRTVTRSQPQSNDGSPKHSKIPKRQSSVSPTRSNKRDASASRKPAESNLGKNQRFISNSTSSIHETIKIGGQVHDKRGISKSTQLLNISPAHIKGKPPISPGRGGPPPSNKSINSKRLSPIVGTPNKSPVEDLKPSSAKTTTKPSPAARKPVKTAGNTPATSRLNSRQPSRNVSRDPSPEKRRTVSKPPVTSRTANNTTGKPVARAASTRLPQKPTVPKTDPKKPINRTNSMKSLTRTPSTRTLNERPPLLTKRDSKKDLKAQSTSKIDEIGKKDVKDPKKSPTKSEKGKDTPGKASVKKEKVEPKKEGTKKFAEAATDAEEIPKQDSETQYDKITNGNGDLVILTKKNIVSMTTAAIMSQPLEVVTTVTNQLPAAFEKAREKGIFERHSSKDSLAPKKEENDPVKNETTDVTKDKPKDSTKDSSKDLIKDVSKETTKDANKDITKDMNKEIIKETTEEDKSHDKQSKTTKSFNETRTIFMEDNIKLKPLLPPYNNPQVERVKQKIDDLLRSPEVSTERISAAAAAAKAKETKTIKNVANIVKNDIQDTKDATAAKLTDLKDQVMKQNEKTTEEIRSEASKIVDSIITPVEEPKEVKPEKPPEVKKEIEPIVMVVNEKKNSPDKNEVTEKMTETLVKGDPEVEVQSSNMSTPGLEKIAVQTKMADGNDSDKSTHSNGGFPQSTSTTPKPPARAHRRDQSKESSNASKETTPPSEPAKPPNICSRLMGKCKTKCCPCCIKPENDENETKDVEAAVEEKRGMMSKLNCCKKKEKDAESEIERAAGKVATIQYESETKRKRKLRDILCGCCGRKRRVSAVSEAAPRHIDDVSAPSHGSDVTAPTVVGDTGCCGKRRPEVERRDSILSDRPPNSCCNNRLFTWMRGACRRKQPEDMSASRRQSLFSKNKSLSPTLPPEDTRTKLDSSLVEHTSMMRGAIPVLPIVLAFFCLLCNICVPGLGTIFSGMFCLCFGIPRFGVHDGAKHRIGSFVINLLVGCGQLFTVLFCLVGWGWSIWWGVIMVKTSRKYRKLKAEEAAAEAEAAPPVTANNHTRA